MVEGHDSRQVDELAQQLATAVEQAVNATAGGKAA
jgi:hypothetical protein